MPCYHLSSFPQFNRSLRLYARKQGYSLNQRGLYKNVVRDPKTNFKTAQGLLQADFDAGSTDMHRLAPLTGVLIASRTEQEIFDILGIRWREPRLRRP